MPLLSSGQELSEEKAMLTQKLQEKDKEVKHLELALSNLRAELLKKDSELVEVRARSNEVRLHVHKYVMKKYAYFSF